VGTRVSVVGALPPLHSGVPGAVRKNTCEVRRASLRHRFGRKQPSGSRSCPKTSPDAGARWRLLGCGASHSHPGSDARTNAGWIGQKVRLR